MRRVAAIAMGVVLGAMAAGCGAGRGYPAPAPARAAGTELAAPRARERMQVDGRDHEAVWKRAPAVALAHATRGAAVLHPTTVRAAWDARALHLFFTCADPDIWGTLSRHDDKLWEEEVVEAFIDSGNDGKDYIEIEVSPRNVTFDASIESFPPTRENIPIYARFEAVGMKTAVVVRGTLDDRDDVDQGWDCEIAIPWSAFAETRGRPPRPGSAWSGNFFRCDLSNGRGEYQAWNTVRGSFHQPERFGRVVFGR